MHPLRSFIPPLAVMLMAASGGASAQGVLIDKSEIRFATKQMGAGVEGRFRRWKANVVFRPKDVAHSKADFEVELASVDLASDESEGEVRGPFWFDTAKYPVARFASESIKDLGANRYEIAGKMSIKGVSRDVVVPIVLKNDPAGNSVAEGEFTIRRLDFKLGDDGVWADTDVVANDVTIRVRMVLPRVS